MCHCTSSQTTSPHLIPAARTINSPHTSRPSHTHTSRVELCECVIHLFIYAASVYIIFIYSIKRPLTDCCANEPIMFYTICFFSNFFFLLFFSLFLSLSPLRYSFFRSLSSSLRRLFLSPSTLQDRPQLKKI